MKKIFLTLFLIPIYLPLFSYDSTFAKLEKRYFGSEKPVSPAIDFVPSSLFAGGSAISVWLRAAINEPGTVYFALYSSNPGVLTAADVRNHAINVGSQIASEVPGTPGPSITAQVQVFTAASTPVNPSFPGTPYAGARFIGGLATNTVYYYRIVAFDDTGTNSTTVRAGTVTTSGGTCSASSPGSNQSGSESDVCGDRDVQFNMSLTGIPYGDPYFIRFRYFFLFEQNGILGTPIDVAPTLDTPTELNYLNQRWIGSAAFNYPDNGTICAYNARAFLAYTELGHCGSIFQDQVFEVFDDLGNTNLGQININPEEIEVCEGSEALINFTNGSVMNCMPPEETEKPNEQIRWYQYEYGINNADVDFMDKVQIIVPPGVDPNFPAGTTITSFPYSGPVLLVNSSAPFGVPAGTSLPQSFDIRVLNTNVFGPDNFFRVRLRMWNVCNPYDNDINAEFPVTGLDPTSGDYTNGDEDPITDESYIELVQQPPTPTSTAQTICRFGALPNYTIDYAGASASVRWYNKNPATDPSAVLIATTPANSKTLPATTAGQVATPNTATTGVYSVWAIYQRVTTGTATCFSNPVEAMIIIKPGLAAPGIPDGLTSVCNGSTLVAFSQPTPAPSTTIPANTFTNSAPVNLSTQYLWSITGGGGVTLSSTVGQNITANFNIGPEPNPSATRNISTLLQYASGATCNTGPGTKTVTVFGTTVGGSVAPNATICNGASTGILTLSGHRGSVLRWERIFNAGAPVVIANTSSTYNEVPPNGPGTYTYRAVIQNGTCTEQNSTAATIVVNQIPAQPVISQGLGSNGLSICANGTQQTILQSDNPGGIAARFDWFRNGALVQSGVSSTITLSTTSQSGNYTVQVFGPAPTNCPSPVSLPTTVTINELPTALISGGGSICFATPAPDIVFTLTGTAPWTLVYARDGVSQPPIIINSSPYNLVAPVGDASADGILYTIVSVTDSNSPNCSITDPHINIDNSANVRVRDIATLPPSLESFTAETAVCDDAGSTDPPDALLDLAPNSAQTYNVVYKINGGPDNFIYNYTTLADGVVRISPTYLQLGNVPGTYSVTITGLVNVGTGCSGPVPIAGPDLVINPKPADPANPIDNIACSTGPSEQLAVNDPGAGATILWFVDATLTTPAINAPASPTGNNGELFTPQTNATATYYAIAQSNIAPTNCRSDNSVAIVHTQDLSPSPASVGPAVQTCNTAFTLSAVPADNGGTGTWTVGGTLYYETFSSADNGLGITGPNPHATNYIHPSGNWSVSVPTNTTFTQIDDWIRVENGALSARDVNNAEVVWQSSVLNISASGNVTISAQATEFGTQAAGDYIRLYYKLNGGAEIQFGDITDDLSINGAFQTFTVPSISGNTLQIVARIRNNADPDFHLLDNIIVTSAGSSVPIIADVNDPLSAVSNLQAGVNSFTWTIQSALGACPPSFANFTITRNPQPVSVNLPYELCETTVSTLTHTAYNLTVHNGDVSDNVPQRTVTWFSDANLTAAVPDPTNMDISDGDVFYARIVNDVTTCNNVNPVLNPGSVTFTVNPLPAANNQLYVVCEQTVGSADKDDNNLPLLFNDDITGIASSANRTVMWYLDPGVPVNDPSDLLTNVATPNDVDNVTDGTVFYALVTNTITGCQSIASVSYDIRPRPGNNPIIGQPNICVGSTTILYQITNITPGSTYVWNLPPNNPGFFEKFAGGGLNDFFVLLRFPGLVSPADPDIYNISVTEISPNPDACSGVPQNFTITVESSPSVNPITGANPVCKLQAGVVYKVTSININNTYSWTVTSGDAAIVGASSGTGLGQIIVDFGTSNSSTISVVETSPTGCALPAAQTITINANDQPVMTSPGSSDLCSGNPVSSVLSFTSSIAGTTYGWRVISITGAIGGTAVNNIGTGNIGEVLTNFSGAVGSVTYRVTPTTPAGCQGPTQDVIITVNPEPVIVIGQTKTICSGSAANVEILLSPLNLPASTVFDWNAPVMSNASVQGSSGTNVAAGSSGTLHITDVLINTGSSPITATYTIVPRNGSCAGSSRTIIVTVLPEPTPSALMLTKPSICSDVLFSFDPQNDISNGVSSTFTWTAVYQGILSGGVGSGSGIISETLNNSSPSTLNATYTITPVGANGCPGDVFTVVMPILPEPVGSNGLLVAVCSNSPFTINPQSNITNSIVSTFSWSASYAAGLSGGAVNGTGVINETLLNISNGNLDATYTITPTGSNGCIGNLFTVTVPVKPEPVGAPSTKPAVCSDVPFSFNPQTDITNGTISTFSWSAIYDPGLTGGINSGTGLITETLTNVTGSILNATYTVVPTGTNGCPGTPFTIVVPVRREPIGSNATKTPVCSDAAFSFDPQNDITNGLTATFTWVASYPAGLTGGAGTGNGLIAEALTNLTSGVLNAQYTVTPMGSNGCAGNTFVITVPVRPKPVGNSSTKSPVCSDVSFNFDPQANISNSVTSTFTWIAVYDAGLTGGAGNGTGAISETLNNVSNSVLNATYTISPSAVTGGCAGAIFTIVVPIRPKPVGSAGAKPAVCSDAPFSFSPQTDITNGVTSTFTWTATYQAGLTGGLAGGTGNISGTLTNTSGVVLNAVYTITPKSSDGCDGASFVITVPVRSEPLGNNVVKATVCSDIAFNFDPQADITNSVNSTFAWTASYPGGLTGGAGVGSGTIAETLTNTTGTTLNAVYTVTPTSTNGCPGSSFTITVPVASEPVGSLVTKPDQCSDVPFSFDPQLDINNGITSSFSWTATYPAGITGGAGSGLGVISETLTNISGTTRIVDYTVTPTSGSGCIGSPYTIRVPVKSEPAGGNVIKAAQCSDLPFTINPQLDITNGIASTFTWTATYDAGLTGGALSGSGSINATLTNLTGSVRNAYYTITPSGTNGCAGNAFVITMPVNSEPVGADVTLVPPICSDAAFSYNPQNEISNGVTSTFSWAAIYDVGLTGGVANGTGNITGTLSNETGTALNAEFTVTPVSTNGCSGSSFKMTVQVDPQPVLDPSLNAKTICSSDATGIVLSTNGVSVGAAAYNITLVSKDAALTGTPTTGNGIAANAIQNDSYLNTTSTPLKVIYRIVPIGPPTNNCPGDPLDITVTVNAEPVVNPALDNEVCSREISGIILSTNGTSVAATSYRLANVTVPGTITADGGNTLTGATGGINLIRNDKYTNTTSATVIVTYEIIPISTIGPLSCEGQPEFIQLSVKPEPILVPGAVTVCSGSPSGIILGTAPGSAAITEYELKSISNPGNITSNGTNAGLGVYTTSNFLANDIFINTKNISQQIIYTITPVSSGCRGTDQQVVLTIDPAPAVANGLDQTVCSGTITGVALATDLNSVAASSYEITSITVAAGLTPLVFNAATPRVTANINEIRNDQFQNSTLNVLTVLYRIVPISAAGCRGPEKTITVRVEPGPSVTVNNLSPSICSGNAVNITLNSSTQPSAGNIVYRITASSTSPLVTGYSSVLTNLPNSYTIQDVLVNNDNVPRTVTYEVTPIALGANDGNGCTGLPVQTVVTVEPQPKVTTVPNKTICENVALGVSLVSPTLPSAGNIEFLVQSFPDAGITGSSNNVVFNNSDVLNDVLINATSGSLKVRYVVTPRTIGLASNCNGGQMTFEITVKPSPVYTGIVIANNPICSGDVVNIQLTSDVTESETITNWTVNAPATIRGESNGVGNEVFQILFNDAGTPGTVDYTFTPKANGCTGPSETRSIIVNPRPKITGSLNTTICHGGTLNINLSNFVTVAGSTFVWTVDDPSGLGAPGAFNGSGTTINQVLTNTSGVQATLTYTITPTGPGNCDGEQKVVLVTVATDVNAQFTNASDLYICKGSSEYLLIAADGDAPLELVYNNGTTNVTLSNIGNFKVIPVTPTVTTTYSLVSIKNKFPVCPPKNLSQSVTVHVGETDASFNIAGINSACSPFNVTFEYSEVAGTQYTWQWFDGSPDRVINAVSTQLDTVHHLFNNPNPNGAVTYKVTLRTELSDPNYPGGCFKTTTKNVTVFPTILVNTFAQPDTIICSGEKIEFINQTIGATTHKWFYRIQGNVGQELDIRSTKNVNYTFTNHTLSDPIVYEVVYQPSNGSCPKEKITLVTVYRGVTASFSEGAVPPFVAGNSTVTFTNNSVPIDGADFEYNWSFGADANPGTQSGTNPTYTVNYSSPGIKEVELTAVNMTARNDGRTCENTFKKTINILLPPLVASFRVIPLAACFPSDIEVVENNSTGDVFEWQVIDQGGRIAATSNSPNPIFRIINPGKYDVFLTTKNSLTGQTAFAQVNGIEIYDLPHASFEARPTTLFVPDTELTTFNFSTGANFYSWDFDDGTESSDFEPKHFYALEGKYTITLVAGNDHGMKDLNGDGVLDENVVCTDTTKREINAREGGLTKIPNAFTPNPNGASGGDPGSGTFNDVFLPITKGVIEFNMQIYDRWGNLVFESNDKTQGWDGYDRSKNLLPAGVYVYKLTLRLADGQRTTQLGDVTLIR